jgi:hypothetical protein
MSGRTEFAMEHNIPRGPYPAPHGWRCFHCDDVFTSRAQAAAHFGVAPSAEPFCVTKLKRGENWAAARIRDLEQERDELECRLTAARLGLGRDGENESVIRLRAMRGLLHDAEDQKP